MSNPPTVYAAGFIVARPSHNGVEFLLLRNACHGTWGPPKGHREPGEDDRTCARRELAEETGITEFAVTPGFAEVSRYTPKGERDAGCIKQVTLFLATVGDVTIEPSNEHAEFRWVPLQSALSLLQFDSLRTIFRTADESL